MHAERSRLAAGLLLSSALGTIHAFSLFLEPLESELNASRAEISAAYAIALLSLTASVFVVGERRAWPSPQLIPALCALVGAGGLLLASAASTLPLLYIGYGVLFGGANGVGYAYALELVSVRSDGRSGGPAMAMVTAVYALGASVGALLLATPIDRLGPDGGLQILAGVIAVTGIVCSALLVLAGVRLDRQRSSAGLAEPGLHEIAWMWLSYGTAVFAGLMALAHVAAIVEAAGGSNTQGVTAAVLIGLANAVGGFLVARGITKHSRSLTIWLPAISAAALLLGAVGRLEVVLPALALVGFAYGALIAVYPPLIAEIVGADRYPRVYGRVFTAWGVAGLAGPIVAGAVFDQTSSYSGALVAAALLAATSSLCARRVVQSMGSAAP